jgi:putative NIF3 family GTP cyclohydrolase 1 type 2
MSVSDIISYIEEAFGVKHYNIDSKKFRLEYRNNNSKNNYKIKRILVTLAITYESLIHAIKNKVNLIITCFGLIDKPIKSFDRYLVKKLNLLSKSYSSIYTIDTSIIGSEYGSSATLAEILFLKTDALFKINSNYNSIPIGRICIPKKYPISNANFLFEDLIKRVKNNLELENLSYIGDLNKKIKKICIVASKCPEIGKIKKIINSGCDSLLCCGINTQEAIFAKELNFNLINIPLFKLLDLTLRKFYKILSLEFPNHKIFYFNSQYTLIKH